MVFKRFSSFVTLGVAMFSLTACSSQTLLTINENDTWNLDAHITQPHSDSALACDDIVPGLKNLTKLSTVHIEDKSTDKVSDCRLVIKNQPIAVASSPFVTIKHYGNDYRVSLESSDELQNISQDASSVQLSITFPGPVLSVHPSADAHIDGNTVTWNSARPLRSGFEVSGQDHPGATFNDKLLILFGVVAAFIGLWLWTNRSSERGLLWRSNLHKLWEKLKIRLKEFSHSLYMFADRSEKWVKKQTASGKKHYKQKAGTKAEPANTRKADEADPGKTDPGKTDPDVSKTDAPNTGEPETSSSKTV